MKQVRRGLYIGTAEDAKMFLSGRKSGITHMLSLEKVRVRKFKPKKKGMSKLQQALLECSKPKEDDHVYQAVSQELKAKCSSWNGGITRKELLLKDTVEENVLDSLSECLDFVDQGREEGIVLVHCGAGISRSAAVVTAYLMRAENMKRDDALASLKECSPQVSPNDGFMSQLQEFEQSNLQSQTKD